MTVWATSAEGTDTHVTDIATLRLNRPTGAIQWKSTWSQKIICTIVLSSAVKCSSMYWWKPKPHAFFMMASYNTWPNPCPLELLPAWPCICSFPFVSTWGHEDIGAKGQEGIKALRQDSIWLGVIKWHDKKEISPHTITKSKSSYNFLCKQV